MSKIRIFIAVAVTYMLLLPSGLSAGLTDNQYEIIRVAFMNGYINAISADIETLKDLKEDKAKMKKFSELAVKKYLDKVWKMNNNEEKKKSI